MFNCQQYKSPRKSVSSVFQKTFETTSVQQLEMHLFTLPRFSIGCYIEEMRGIITFKNAIFWDELTQKFSHYLSYPVKVQAAQATQAI